MEIDEIVNFITEHWVAICANMGMLHILAKLIVAWTPTPKDNELLEKIVKAIKTILGIIGMQPPAKKVIENQ